MTLHLDTSSQNKRDGYQPKATPSALASQILIYIPGLLIPGLVNFLALAMYTRILSTEAYGRYALVLAVVITVKMVIFEWLRLGLLRYFQVRQNEGDLNALISTTMAGYVVTSMVVSILWVAFLIFVPIDKSLIHDLWLALPLLLVWTLFEFILQLNRAALTSIRYGFLSANKAIVGLAAGLMFLLLFKQKENGVLLGLIFGTTVSVLIDVTRWISRFKLQLIKRKIATDLLSYGMPLTLTLALGLVISLSDRFLLQHFLGSAAVGVYAASYDLANQSIMMVFTLLNLAAYPIVLKVLEQEGKESARDQLRRYAVILFALALPSSVGLAAIAKPVCSIFLGEAFRQVAGEIIPWVAMSTLLMGAKAFYADLSFQIGLRTHLQIWPVSAAAVLNVLLNLWWIPIYGVMGAARSTCAAHLLALVISFTLGRGVFALPFPFLEICRIVLATSIMAIVLLSTPTSNGGWYELSILLGIGMASYSILIWIMDVGEIRRRLLPHIQYLKGLAKKNLNNRFKI